MITINQVKATAFYAPKKSITNYFKLKTKEIILVVAYHNTSKQITKVKKNT